MGEEVKVHVLSFWKSGRKFQAVRKQVEACRSSPAAICYWFVVSLVAWGMLSLIGIYWLHAPSAAACLFAMAVGCLANWFKNRSFHCAITGPLFLVAGVAFLLAGVRVVHVDTLLVWRFVLVGTGIAFLLEWWYAKRSNFNRQNHRLNVSGSISGKLGDVAKPGCATQTHVCVTLLPVPPGAFLEEQMTASQWDLRSLFYIHPFVVLFVFLFLVLVPIVQLLRRTGHHSVWCLLAIFPVLNLGALWFFAFKPWSTDKKSGNIGN
jgi:hypothetical protein